MSGLGEPTPRKVGLPSSGVDGVVLAWRDRVDDTTPWSAGSATSRSSTPRRRLDLLIDPGPGAAKLTRLDRISRRTSTWVGTVVVVVGARAAVVVVVAGHVVDDDVNLLLDLTDE
jgi:hypothetical protein